MTTNESFLKQYAQPEDIVVCEDGSRLYVTGDKRLTDLKTYSGHYIVSGIYVNELKIKEILRIDWNNTADYCRNYRCVVYKVVATFPKEPTEKEKRLERIAAIEKELAELKRLEK